MDAKVGRPSRPGTILHSVLTSADFGSSSLSLISTTIPPSFVSSGRGFTSILENKASEFMFFRACFPAPMLKMWPGRSCWGSSRSMIASWVFPSTMFPSLSWNWYSTLVISPSTTSHTTSLVLRFPKFTTWAHTKPSLWYHFWTWSLIFCSILALTFSCFFIIPSTSPRTFSGNMHGLAPRTRCW
uniref:Uncharacterized protein n=1 Tax=Arundo donax TaxID=35708 RepID=A0A0A9HQK6_ARUDO